MNDPTTIAKPWYLSKTVLSLAAGLVMSLAPKVLKTIGVDIPITQDQANEFVAFAIPQAFALYGRITATRLVTGSAASAQAINERAVA